MKVLFVCTGNICRSPMAEIIFRNICIANGHKDIKVSSAGTSAQDGMAMTSEAFKALKLCGEKIDEKEMLATRFRNNMVKEFDLIITMTLQHAQIIGAHYENVKTLNDYSGCGDIFDPYMCSIETYIHVCKMLQKALVLLYNALFNK